MGGTTPYQFKWWRYDGARWTVARDWSSVPTFSWAPSAAGSYAWKVYGRSAGNAGDAFEVVALSPSLSIRAAPTDATR